MVKVGVAGFISDLFFEFMDRARSFDCFDATAVCADEVVAVLARN
jgi:hypothetical protein